MVTPHVETQSYRLPYHLLRRENFTFMIQIWDLPVDS